MYTAFGLDRILAGQNTMSFAGVKVKLEQYQYNKAQPTLAENPLCSGYTWVFPFSFLHLTFSENAMEFVCDIE